jgi:gliding motility-associated lipoprotein GldH
MKGFALAAVGCLMMLSACDSSTIYDESEDLVTETWVDTDTLTARFEITDTNHYHTVYLNTRFTSLYKFSNIYYQVVLSGPNGQRATEIVSFEVTDKAGKWLGSGYGNLHSYAFPILDNRIFKQIGKYKVKVVPYMRISSLEGIHDRGIKVSKGKEIF